MAHQKKEQQFVKTESSSQTISLCREAYEAFDEVFWRPNSSFQLILLSTSMVRQPFTISLMCQGMFFQFLNSLEQLLVISLQSSASLTPQKGREPQSIQQQIMPRDQISDLELYFLWFSNSGLMQKGVPMRSERHRESQLQILQAKPKSTITTLNLSSHMMLEGLRSLCIMSFESRYSTPFKMPLNIFQHSAIDSFFFFLSNVSRGWPYWNLSIRQKQLCSSYVPRRRETKADSRPLRISASFLASSQEVLSLTDFLTFFTAAVLPVAVSAKQTWEKLPSATIFMLLTKSPDIVRVESFIDVKVSKPKSILVRKSRDNVTFTNNFLYRQFIQNQIDSKKWKINSFLLNQLECLLIPLSDNPQMFQKTFVETPVKCIIHQGRIKNK